MKSKKCPCEECLIIPICRHKYYVSLFRQCSILTEYERSYTSVLGWDFNRILAIENALKPTKWESHIREDEREDVITKEGVDPYRGEGYVRSTL